MQKPDDILNAALRLSHDVFTAEFGDETVLLHATGGIYYGVDPLGTRILASLGKGENAAAICDELASEFGVERSQVQRDVRTFLTELVELEIIESA